MAINNILDPNQPIVEDNPLETSTSPDVADEADEFDSRDEYDTTYVNNEDNEFDRDDAQSDSPEANEDNMSSEEAVELVEEEIFNEEQELINYEEHEKMEDDFESEDRKSLMPTAEPVVPQPKPTEESKPASQVHQ